MCVYIQYYQVMFLFVCTASPIQILYKCYDFLLKNLKPSIATEILSRKKLLHVNDEENINIAPSQYTKNFIIMEHLRCVDVPSLFVFCYELKKNDEQQYVGSFMLNGKLLLILCDLLYTSSISALVIILRLYFESNNVRLQPSILLNTLLRIHL